MLALVLSRCMVPFSCRSVFLMEDGRLARQPGGTPGLHWVVNRGGVTRALSFFSQISDPRKFEGFPL